MGARFCTDCVDPPYHVRVAPHGSTRGHAKVQLPIGGASICTVWERQHWHLDKQPKRATLSLQLFPQLDRKAKPLPTDETQKIDRNAESVVIESDPLPFPHGTTFDVEPPGKK
jgi:hypothetical protein